jgi:predicted RNA-binding protein Jag
MTSANNKNSDNTYKAPDLSPEQVTPVVVRDELLKCFESANREFSKTTMNQPPTSSDNQEKQQQLKQQVRQFVESVFQRCDVDFDNPRREGILMAIEECKKNAEAMMGTAGKEVVEHHYEEIMKLVNRL